MMFKDYCGGDTCPLGKEKSERDSDVCIYSKQSLCDYPFVGKKKHPLEKVMDCVPVMVRK